MSKPIIKMSTFTTKYVNLTMIDIVNLLDAAYPGEFDKLYFFDGDVVIGPDKIEKQQITGDSKITITLRSAESDCTRN